MSNQDAGPQTLAGWATFDPGAANEAGQTATYTLSNIGNPALFDAAPSIDGTGTLTYTAAAGVVGASTFDLMVQDSGGTANGGMDASSG